VLDKEGKQGYNHIGVGASRFGGTKKEQEREAV
jgi:hypothetical protein